MKKLLLLLMLLYSSQTYASDLIVTTEEYFTQTLQLSPTAFVVVALFYIVNVLSKHYTGESIGYNLYEFSIDLFKLKKDDKEK